MLFFLAHIASAADVSISIIDQKSSPVSDAYVELIALDGSGRALKQKGIIDQVDKEFDPLVSAVPVGTVVSFPNSDNIQHQIYSFSKTKSFELPLFAKNNTQSVQFDQAGIVNMGCNIHDWMLSYLYVYESQWFGAVDKKGDVSFVGIAAGAYTLRVWSPRMKNNRSIVEKEVIVHEAENSTVVQSLKVRKKIRRRPRVEGDAYE
jgi:plastocyanin